VSEEYIIRSSVLGVEFEAIALEALDGVGAPFDLRLFLCPDGIPNTANPPFCSQNSAMRPSMQKPVSLKHRWAPWTAIGFHTDSPTSAITKPIIIRRMWVFLSVSNNEITRFVHNCALFLAHLWNSLDTIRNILREPEFIQQGDIKTSVFLPLP